MAKSSIDYSELSGLKITLTHMKTYPEPDTQVVIDWIKARVAYLETK